MGVGTGVGVGEGVGVVAGQAQADTRVIRMSVNANNRFTLPLLVMQPSYSINLMIYDVPVSSDTERFRITLSSVMFNKLGAIDK